MRQPQCQPGVVVFYWKRLEVHCSPERHFLLQARGNARLQVPRWERVVLYSLWEAAWVLDM